MECRGSPLMPVWVTVYEGGMVYIRDVVSLRPCDVERTEQMAGSGGASHGRRGSVSGHRNRPASPGREATQLCLR